MAIGIGRRELISLFGGAALTWPLAARAQQPALSVIGFLHIGTPFVYALGGLRQGLKDAGYVEGQNVAVEYRWAKNDEPAACRNWRLISFAVGWPSIVAGGTCRRRSPPSVNQHNSHRLRRRAGTRSEQESSPASTGRAATSPASTS